MSLIDDFNKAKQAIYDHVGFVEDYVIYPIEDYTEMYWKITPEYASWMREMHEKQTGEKLEPSESQGVTFHETKEFVEDRDGNSYEHEIYTQRFYSKWIYRGEKYTMIFVDTHTDGNKFFAIYDNEKEVKNA